MTWFTEHLAEITAVVIGVMAVSRVIVGWTKTTADDAVWQKVANALKSLLGIDVEKKP